MKIVKANDRDVLYVRHWFKWYWVRGKVWSLVVREKLSQPQEAQK